MQEQQPRIQIALVGQTDHGKSTMLGRLLYDTQQLDEKLIKNINRLIDQEGEDKVEFAWIVDFNTVDKAEVKELKSRRPGERWKKGERKAKTIHPGKRVYQTQKKRIIFQDLPGHPRLLKNLIRGAYGVDYAILVVSAEKGEFETGIGEAKTRPEDPGGFTIEHAKLMRIYGVSKLIVAVSQMDTVNWDERRFEEIHTKLIKLLADKEVGYPTNALEFVSISGQFGDNLISRSKRMNWYKGKTLSDVLESLDTPPVSEQLPLRIAVSWQTRRQRVGPIVLGRILSGVLTRNQELIGMPGKIKTRVKTIHQSIHMADKRGKGIPVETAYPGDEITLSLSTLGDQSIEIDTGHVLGPVKNPPSLASEILCQMYVLSSATRRFDNMQGATFNAHNATFRVKNAEILEAKEAESSSPVDTSLEKIEQDTAIVARLELEQPVVLECFKEFHQLGKFVVRQQRKIMAHGIVTDILQ